MPCCGRKRSKDSIECYSSVWGGKPSECMEIPVTTGSTHKTLSLPCLRSKSKTALAEKDYETVLLAFYFLTSNFAKIQFRIRQIIIAQSGERDRLLFELASAAFCGTEEFKCDGLPRMEKDSSCLGNIRRRRRILMQRLRDQIGVLSDKTVPAEPDEETEDEKPQKNKSGSMKKDEKKKKKETRKEESKKGKQKQKVKENESGMDESSAGEMELLVKKESKH